MKTIDIPLLRTIIAFADSGSCQGAADIVHRTQAAVSVHLKRLEKVAGGRLFVKKGRQLMLTADGHTLVSYARRIIRLHNEAIANFETTSYSGTLRIGLPDDYISVLLNPMLQAFETALPKAQIELLCAPSAMLRPMLQNNSLDFAIVSGETDTQEGHVLRQEATHWIAASGYQHDAPGNLKLLLFPEGCILRKWALNALNAKEVEYEIVFTSHNMQALKTAMSHGLGVMIATQCNVPVGSVILTEKAGLPPLPDVTVMLIASSGVDQSVVEPLHAALRNHVEWPGAGIGNINSN
jgi:DNA-binding transcriptional LysR family regulator